MLQVKLSLNFGLQQFLLFLGYFCQAPFKLGMVCVWKNEAYLSLWPRKLGNHCDSNYPAITGVLWTLGHTHYEGVGGLTPDPTSPTDAAAWLQARNLRYLLTLTEQVSGPIVNKALTVGITGYKMNGGLMKEKHQQESNWHEKGDTMFDKYNEETGRYKIIIIFSTFCIHFNDPRVIIFSSSLPVVGSQ